jgi:hypothetical protein
MRTNKLYAISSILMSFACCAVAAGTSIDIGNNSMTYSDSDTTSNSRMIKAGTHSVADNQKHSNFCKQRYGANAVDATDLADITLGKDTTDSVLCIMSDENLQPSGADTYITAVAPNDNLVYQYPYNYYLTGSATLFNVSYGGIFTIISTMDDTYCSAGYSYFFTAPMKNMTFQASVTNDCTGLTPVINDHRDFPTHTTASFARTSRKNGHYITDTDTGLIKVTL